MSAVRSRPVTRPLTIVAAPLPLIETPPSFALTVKWALPVVRKPCCIRAATSALCLGSCLGKDGTAVGSGETFGPLPPDEEHAPAKTATATSPAARVSRGTRGTGVLFPGQR